VLVEDIVAKANVSARTFNNYFSSKEEAICAISTDRIAASWPRSARAPPTNRSGTR